MKARSFGTVVAVTMVASGLLLAACGKSSTGSGSSSTTSVGPKSSDLAASLGAHNWVLDPAHSTVDAPADHPIDLKFPDAHTATGTASCNT
ncbi:MAG: hypothetical protein JST73_03015, partial [Actinobacteria bacterium]|nr:hypothetical protein [Actinomycetota bacterium]